MDDRIPQVLLRDRWLRAASDLAATATAICIGCTIAVVYALLATPTDIHITDAVSGIRAAFWREEAVLPMLVVAALFFCGAYSSSGIYSRFKFARILQGITAAYCGYVIALYLLVRQPPEARACLLASYVLTVAILVGLRKVVALLLTAEAQAKPGLALVSNEKHVLVIGGAGYIGSLLVGNLLESGYTVRVLDNLTYGDRAIRPLLDHPRLEMKHADMRHLESLAMAIRGVHSVVHLGAIVGDPACALDNDTTVEINLLATRLVRDLCNAFDVHRLIFASTCSVYGAGQGLSDEKSALNPVSLYACTKIDSERCLLESRGSCGAVILRLATVFGLSPRPRFDLVVNLLSAQAQFRREFTIYNPTQWRPLIHVADVCRALQMCLEAEGSAVHNEIFNLGDDRMNFTLGQIGTMVCERFPEATMHCVEKTADHRDYRVDFKKIRETLGFRCVHHLQQGIEELRSAFESESITDYRDPFYYNLDYLRNVPTKKLDILGHDGVSREFLVQSAQAGR